MASPGKVENYANQQPVTVTAKLYNFEVGKFDIKTEHSTYLINVVAPILRKGGSLSMMGLASRTGSDALNQKLSENRSKAVIAVLRRHVPNNFQVTIELAMGERAAAFAGVKDGVEQENWRAVVISVWDKPSPPPPPPPPPTKRVDVPEPMIARVSYAEFLGAMSFKELDDPKTIGISNAAAQHDLKYQFATTKQKVQKLSSKIVQISLNYSTDGSFNTGLAQGDFKTCLVEYLWGDRKVAYCILVNGYYRVQHESLKKRNPLVYQLKDWEADLWVRNPVEAYFGHHSWQHNGITWEAYKSWNLPPPTAFWKWW